MTHVKALQAGYLARGHLSLLRRVIIYSLMLLMIIAHTFVINGTTLVHAIHELVGKYIMEQCNVDFCYNLYTQIRFI